MNFITKSIYWLCLIAIVAIAVLSFVYLGWQIGVSVLAALPVFVIAYALSDRIAVSRRDKYARSEWSVFCKKIGWAWGMALVVYAIVYIVIAYNFGDPMGVMPE